MRSIFISKRKSLRVKTEVMKVKFDADKFAAKVRAKRAELDITQAELAERCGVNLTTICAYENGAAIPGADKVVLLCHALDATPDFFLLS